MALFFALAIVIEYLVVYLFRSYGLADTQTFLLLSPVLTVTISPLFHLVPLGVILVLVFSWTYLTQYIAKVPRKGASMKKPSARKPLKKTRKKRFKSIRGFFTKVNRKLRNVTQVLKTSYRRISAGVLRIRGVSPMMQRISFARAAINSAVTVVLIFLVSFLTVYLMGYPSLIYDIVVGLYQGSPSFHGFVIGTIEAAGSIGRALSPIGWLASAVNNALIVAAPGFRSALEGFAASIAGPLIGLDLVWRYVICQNVAAWVSAIAALIYAQYTPRLYRRFRR